MIVLPSGRSRVEPVLFRFDVRDCIDDAGIFARSFGLKVHGVFSRASRKRVVDDRGVLISLPHGMPAVGRFGLGGGLLLEPARMNLCVWSEDLDNASWTKSPGVTITANATAAPDGTLTADLITNDGLSAFNQVTATIVYTGDGEKCFAIYLKAGTAPVTQISMYDVTALIHRHRVTITWTNGVPTLSSSIGSGEVFPVEPLRDGWYRILFSGASNVAANSNRFILYPTGSGVAVAGTLYAWGAQAENAGVPSSYIKTEGSTVTRSADSLHFPFKAVPRAMTVYARGIERGNRYSPSTPRFVSITGAAGGDPRFLLYCTSGGAVAAFHDNDVDAAVSAGSVGSARVLGDVLEARGVLRADGRVVPANSINGGPETVGGASVAPANGLPAAWSDERLYLTGPIVEGLFAFTHVVVASGERSMDEMRELAGV